MSGTLADITRNCATSNAKGLKGTIYIAKVEDVATIPDAGAGTHTVSTNITMDGTEVFHSWPISKEVDKNTYESNSEGDRDSNNFVTTLNAFIAKLDATKTYILATSSNGCEYIVLFEDKNGLVRIIGELEDGCTLKVNEKSADAGYEVEIRWDSALPPLYYTGTIPV